MNLAVIYSLIMGGLTFGLVIAVVLVRIDNRRLEMRTRRYQESYDAWKRRAP